ADAPQRAGGPTERSPHEEDRPEETDPVPRDGRQADGRAGEGGSGRTGRLDPPARAPLDLGFRAGLLRLTLLLTSSKAAGAPRLQGLGAVPGSPTSSPTSRAGPRPAQQPGLPCRLQELRRSVQAN